MTSHVLTRTVFALLLLPSFPLTLIAQTAPATSQMVRAAGMPLQVSDLPPGTLVVRIVRGAFVENLAGQSISVEIDGKARQAATDAQGRATIAAGVGATVRASVVIDGEPLASETFTMPATGGVRVLLVAGGADAGVVPPSGALPVGHPAIGVTPAPLPQPPGAAPSSSSSARTAIAGLLGLLTVASAFFITGRFRRLR